MEFHCAICLDKHSMEDCYIASACGHRMCRDAARNVILEAVRYASDLPSSAQIYPARIVCMIFHRMLSTEFPIPRAGAVV